MTRNLKAMETVAMATADLFDTVEAYDVWAEDEYEAYINSVNEEYYANKGWAERQISKPVVYSNYECKGKVYVARSLGEAYLMALNEFGVEAIGANVRCLDNSDFSLNVCLDAYRRAFPNFTDEEILAYEIACNYAWVNFKKEVGYDYYEETETVALCADGKQYIRDNSSLARYMDEVHFQW